MILSAKFTNIYSFNSETTISFEAGKGTSHGNHVSWAEKRDDISVLKSALIYGDNASGKTNTIRCIRIIQKIATGTFPRHNWEVFKLSQEPKLEASISLKIKCGDEYYEYSVSFTKINITKENLYKVGSRKRHLVFSRKLGKSGTIYRLCDIIGTDEDKQFDNFIADGTSDDVSFLSEYQKRKGRGMSSLSIVYNWFDNYLKIIFPDTRFRGISVRLENDRAFSEEVGNMLDYFNTGIHDIRRVPVAKEQVEIPVQVVEKLLAAIKHGEGCCVASEKQNTVYFIESDNEGQAQFFKQMTVHNLKNHQQCEFDMSEESDGSIRLLDFLPMLIDLHRNPSVYLVDEIDRSLHPLKTLQILKYYFSRISKNLDSQLICTTHESTLLNTDNVRTDEIWIAEKDYMGSTQFSNLSKFKPQKDIRKGYLQGKYSQLPFTSEASNLVDEANCNIK